VRRSRGDGPVVVGLDGCPTGWVAVTMRAGTVMSVAVVDDVRAALVLTPAVVAIDMPVGLVDAPRDTDAAARVLLPGRASSVFNTAPRSVVEGWLDGTVTTHAEASDLTRTITGVGLSQQAWRLVPKMAEVERLAAGGPGALEGGGGATAPTAPDVREVHPELAFATVAGAPLPRKRSWAGLRARTRLLAGLGVELPDRFPGDVRAAPDDVVDAAICAWVADGVASGAQVVAVPEHTDQRAHGRPIVIYVRRP
jgi:predicted RNase H-like nuclease